MNNTTKPATGILYGVGIGPGDPELLTLRAVSVLRSVKVIFAAASPKNDDSLALSIASPHLTGDVEIIRLDFPMTRNRTLLEAAWKGNTRAVSEVLRSGRDAAFLTLGDPLIYSTFGYLMRTLAELDPELDVRVVPGITSFQAAAAKTRTVLCENTENLLLVSGINEAGDLAKALDSADSAVILKAYRNIDAIRAALAETGRGDETVFASRLGLEGEKTLSGLENLPEKPHYLSLIIAPPKR